MRDLGYERAHLDKRIFAFLFDIIIKVLIFLAFYLLLSIFVINPQTSGKSQKISEYNQQYNLQYYDNDSHGFNSRELLDIIIAEDEALELLNDANELQNQGKINEYQIKIDEYQEKLEVARKYCLDKDKSCNLTEDGLKEYLDNVSPLASDVFLANFMGTFSAIIIAGFIYSFFIPLFFQNGQTIGRRLLKLGLVTSKGEKVKTLNLFVRVTSAIAFYFGLFFLFGQFVQFIASFLLILVTKNKLSLQDFLSNTVIIDLTRQTTINPESKLDVV